MTIDLATTATEDIDKANAAVAEYLHSSSTEFKSIEDPGEEEVELPSGLLLKDQLITKAYVRELTGEDEEAIARSLNNVARVTTVILNHGVVSIGDQKATPHTLKELLLGDRAALLIGIRIATYGEKLDYTAYCPTCQEWVEVEIDLTDLKMKKLEDPSKRTFEIELRKGGKAKFVLPDGFIDEELIENESKLNNAQLNTLLLAKCVKYINDKPVIGTKPVQDLGSADRRAILKKITELSPGPDYQSLSFEHDVCGKEVPVPITAGDLFQF